jgi:hypothetical protein
MDLEDQAERSVAVPLNPPTEEASMRTGHNKDSVKHITKFDTPSDDDSIIIGSDSETEDENYYYTHHGNYLVMNDSPPGTTPDTESFGQTGHSQTDHLSAETVTHISELIGYEPDYVDEEKYDFLDELLQSPEEIQEVLDTRNRSTQLCAASLSKCNSSDANPSSKQNGTNINYETPQPNKEVRVQTVEESTFPFGGMIQKVDRFIYLIYIIGLLYILYIIIYYYNIYSINNNIYISIYFILYLLQVYIL